MTIPVSVVPLVKAYLVTAITAQVNDPKVLVSYNVPGPNLPDDVIVVGRISRTPTPLAIVGDGSAGAFIDDFTVEIVASVFRGGDEAQLVEERALELDADVITAIRKDMSLGGLVLKAEPIDNQTDQEWSTGDPQGRLSTSVTLIKCKATY